MEAAANPNGIESLSPGLAAADYPGVSASNEINLEKVVSD